MGLCGPHLREEKYRAFQHCSATRFLLSWERDAGDRPDMSHELNEWGLPVGRAVPGLDVAALAPSDIHARQILSGRSSRDGRPWTGFVEPPLRAVPSAPVDLHALPQAGGRRSL